MIVFLIFIGDRRHLLNIDIDVQLFFLFNILFDFCEKQVFRNKISENKIISLIINENANGCCRNK